MMSLLVQTGNFFRNKDVPMKFKGLVIVGLVLPAMWLCLGCGQVHQDYVKKVKILSGPILDEYESSVIHGEDIFKGVPEEEKEKGRDLRKESLKRLRDTISDGETK